MIHSTTERWNLFFSSPFFNSSLHTLELYIHNCIFMYTSRIYSYKSAPANIALWPTISSPFREANISSENFWRFFPSLDSNTVVENILGQFLSNYESSKARILYIHIYTHIRIRLVIKERSISSGSIGRDDWPATLLPPRLTDFCPETSYYRESNPDIGAIWAPSIDSLRFTDNSPCLRSD